MTGFMGPENPTQAERDQLIRLRTGSPVATAQAAPVAVGGTFTGYDLSSNNTAAQFTDALTKDFVIVKASEGVSYKNPLHDDQIAQARAKGKPVAHYHFSRPDSNGPHAESAWFLKCAKPQPGDVMVNDFEPPSIQPAHPSWVVTFNGDLRAACGVDGWFYTNQSQGTALVKAAGADQLPAIFRMPLWKAYYQADIGDLMGWPDWACWQYTSTPVDTNKFNGDAAKWRSLGVPEANVAQTLTTDDINAIVAALVPAVKTAVLDESVTRQGGWTGTTTLRDIIAYSDSNASNANKAVLAAIAGVPAAEAAEIAKRLTPPATA